MYEKLCLREFVIGAERDIRRQLVCTDSRMLSGCFLLVADVTTESSS